MKNRRGRLGVLVTLVLVLAGCGSEVAPSPRTPALEYTGPGDVALEMGFYFGTVQSPDHGDDWFPLWDEAIIIAQITKSELAMRSADFSVINGFGDFCSTPIIPMRDRREILWDEAAFAVADRATPCTDQELANEALIRSAVESQEFEIVSSERFVLGTLRFDLAGYYDPDTAMPETTELSVTTHSGMPSGVDSEGLWNVMIEHNIDIVFLTQEDHLIATTLGSSTCPDVVSRAWKDNYVVGGFSVSLTMTEYGVPACTEDLTATSSVIAFDGNIRLDLNTEIHDDDSVSIMIDGQNLNMDAMTPGQLVGYRFNTNEAFDLTHLLFD